MLVSGYAFEQLSRLLRNLPTYFNISGKMKPSIKLVSANAGYMTIERRKLSIVTNVTRMEASLDTHTILSLSQYIEGETGIACSVVSDTPNRTAVALPECNVKLGVDEEVILQEFTSTLWNLLTPVAWVLYEARNNVSEAVAKEMAIPTATEEWLDYWGEQYNVNRLPNEDDTAYSRRIIVETVRPRGNNLAIEKAVADSFGAGVLIIDAENMTFRANRDRTFQEYQRTQMPPLTARTLGETTGPGRIYIFMEGENTDAVADVVRIHKVAGIGAKVEVRYQNAAVFGVSQYYVPKGE